jgi:hypothetical protein
VCDHQIAGMIVRGNLSLGYSQWTNPGGVYSLGFRQGARQRACGWSITCRSDPHGFDWIAIAAHKACFSPKTQGGEC